VSPAKIPPEKKKVFVVDDHAVLRRGLAQLVAQEPDLVICGEAADARAALEGMEKTRPDVAVVDVSLPDASGIELIKDIKVRWPKLPVLVLSMYDESFYAERVLRAGASGYVTKGEASEKVIEGIRQILRGEPYVSEKVASRMICKFVKGVPGSKDFSIDALSDREFEVFELIGQGLQTRQIAARLHLSVKTIDTHRENIKRKLGLSKAPELLQRAIQWVRYERGG
jgi:DNA-binding NarL/FixJ family response regulator